MNPKEIRIYIPVLVVLIIAPFVLSSTCPTLQPTSSRLLFNASEAYGLTQEFVTRFPNRVLGSLESRQSTGFIHDSLQNLGYEISYSHFDARTTRRTEVGRNVLAFKKGRSAEILAAVAHLDTARTTGQGATADGSGVGVLLELARVFASAPTNRSLLFIFSDGEEWGMLGTRDIVENYPDRKSIVAVLSLDHVSAGDLGAFCLGESGQQGGFSPPWLRQLARRSAEAQGLPVRAPGGFREHLERAVLISAADQGPFLEAGIPAINLGSESTDLEIQKEIYHSPQDTIDKLKVSSVEKYGLVAERIFRTLDESDSIPKQSSGSLRTWDSRFLKPKAIGFIQLISFLPLPVVLWFQLISSRKRMDRVRIGRELVTSAATVVPLLMIYFMVKLFGAVRWIPVYSLYPAPARDPVLVHPPWNVVGGIFGIALVVALVCWSLTKYFMLEVTKPDFSVSKTILLCLLLVTAVLAFFYNPYWAVSFLLVPAWIWALLQASCSTGARIRNWILIAAAGIPYFVFLWVFASDLGMSWNFIWYQIIAVGTGLFTESAFFLWAATITLGIRFLAIQLHRQANH
jgi:hypothetical protein